MGSIAAGSGHNGPPEGGERPRLGRGGPRLGRTCPLGGRVSSPGGRVASRRAEGGNRRAAPAPSIWKAPHRRRRAALSRWQAASGRAAARQRWAKPATCRALAARLAAPLLRGRNDLALRWVPARSGETASAPRGGVTLKVLAWAGPPRSPAGGPRGLARHGLCGLDLLQVVGELRIGLTFPPQQLDQATQGRPWARMRRRQPPDLLAAPEDDEGLAFRRGPGSEDLRTAVRLLSR